MIMYLPRCVITSLITINIYHKHITPCFRKPVGNKWSSYVQIYISPVNFHIIYRQTVKQIYYNSHLSR